MGARARTWAPRLYVKHVRARGRLSETMAARVDTRAENESTGRERHEISGMPGDF